MVFGRDSDTKREIKREPEQGREEEREREERGVGGKLKMAQ